MVARRAAPVEVLDEHLHDLLRLEDVEELLGPVHVVARPEHLRGHLEALDAAPAVELEPEVVPGRVALVVALLDAEERHGRRVRDVAVGVGREVVRRDHVVGRRRARREHDAVVGVEQLRGDGLREDADLRELLGLRREVDVAEQHLPQPRERGRIASGLSPLADVLVDVAPRGLVGADRVVQRRERAVPAERLERDDVAAGLPVAVADAARDERAGAPRAERSVRQDRRDDADGAVGVVRVKRRQESEDVGLLRVRHELGAHALLDHVASAAALGRAR